jgi:hypothetical protein
MGLSYILRGNMTNEFYPVSYLITAITNAQQATITTSIDHTLTAGQEVRILVPQIFGMYQINGTATDIVSVPTSNSMVVDADTTNFDAFVVPIATNITPAQLIPIGQDAFDGSANQYDDATRNILP